MKILLLPILVLGASVANAPGPVASGPAVPMAGPVQVQRLRLVPAADGNEVRYRVREQLAGVDFPNDAVGSTSAVTGQIVIEDGKVAADESKFVVDLTGLKSDQARRDGYLQRRTLETAQYPTAELVPREFRGFPARIPASGSFTFDLVADLTIHGVTRPTVWKVTALSADSGFTGQAVTSLTFEEAGLVQPRVAVVLSVEDRIQLEYTFRLLPAAPGGP